MLVSSEGVSQTTEGMVSKLPSLVGKYRILPLRSIEYVCVCLGIYLPETNKSHLTVDGLNMHFLWDGLRWIITPL